MNYDNQEVRIVDKNVKKIVMWILVAFVAYMIYKQPTKAGNILGSVLDAAVHAGKSLFIFFDGILT